MRYIKRKFEIISSIFKMIVFDKSNKGEILFRIFAAIGWQIYKRIFTFPIVLPLDNGLSYIADPRAVNSTGVIYTKIYESTYVSFIREHCKKGGILIDIGAHTGLYTLLLNSQFSKSILFEPDPNTCKLLRKNIAINLLENVSIIQAAASNFSGMGSLKVEGDYCGTNHLIRNDDQESRAISVDLLTIDNVISNLAISRVDLIKIDTEGHELEVLQGCRGVLKGSPEILILYENSKFEEVCNFFDEIEFKIFGLDSNGAKITDRGLLKSSYNLFACGPKNLLSKLK